MNMQGGTLPLLPVCAGSKGDLTILQFEKEKKEIIGDQRVARKRGIMNSANTAVFHLVTHIIFIQPKHRNSHPSVLSKEHLTALNSHAV